MKEWDASQVHSAIKHAAGEIAAEKLKEEEVSGGELATLAESRPLLESWVGPRKAIKIVAFLKDRREEELRAEKERREVQKKARMKSIKVLVKSDVDYNQIPLKVPVPAEKFVGVTLCSDSEFTAFFNSVGGMPIKCVYEGGKVNFRAFAKLDDLENGGTYIIDASVSMAMKLKKLEAQVKNHEGALDNQRKNLEKTVGKMPLPLIGDLV